MAHYVSGCFIVVCKFSSLTSATHLYDITTQSTLHILTLNTLFPPQYLRLLSQFLPSTPGLTFLFLVMIAARKSSLDTPTNHRLHCSHFSFHPSFVLTLSLHFLLCPSEFRLFCLRTSPNTQPTPLGYVENGGQHRNHNVVKALTTSHNGSSISRIFLFQKLLSRESTKTDSIYKKPLEL